MKNIHKINKTQNGLQGYRVRLSYTDINGAYKQVERTVYGYDEAQMVLQQLLAEYKVKKTVVTRKTILELYDEYEKYHAHETRLSSHNKAMQILETHILPTMKDCRLDKLSKERLAKWKNSIAEQELSIVTKKNIYQAFNAMLNYAVKLDYIPKNPLSVLGTFKAQIVLTSPPKNFNTIPQNNLLISLP